MPEPKPNLDGVLELLDFDDRDVDQLRQALGATSDDEMVHRLLMLRDHAFRELAEWIVSARRFATIAEMDSARILVLFGKIRGEYPTVEQLVDELGISSSKATSLLSRLRYGEGRALLRLARAAAGREITRKLEAAESDSDGRKTVLLSRASYEEVQAVAFTILSEPAEHKKGGKYEGAEVPITTSAGRLGGGVTTSERMWQHITAVIEERSK